jgi:mannose-6-phosphate isomerase-like protein (cupin superfamily)
MSDYTIMRAGDAPDYTQGQVPSPFLGYARPMGAEQLALNVRVLAPGAAHVPPGGDPSGGHAHKTIEEIYFVIDGELTLKLGGDEVTLSKRDAVLIPAGTPRAARNLTGEEVAFAMVSIKVADPMAETVPLEGVWPTG